VNLPSNNDNKKFVTVGARINRFFVFKLNKKFAVQDCEWWIINITDVLVNVIMFSFSVTV